MSEFQDFERSSKKVLEQTKCPKCPSSDAFTIWEEGNDLNAHCFSCGYHVKRLPSNYKDLVNSGYDSAGVSRLSRSTTVRQPTSVRSQGLSEIQELDVPTLSNFPIRAFSDRGLSQATVAKYEVRCGVSTSDGDTPICHLYPIRSKGQLVQYKVRDCAVKNFTIIGNKPETTDLFGQSLFKPTGKKLWITEGEIDAMSVYQVLKESSTLPDYDPPVVSLPHGAAAAVKAITENLYWLNGYEEIILVFDSDAAGVEARDKVCKLLAGKVYYVELPAKDPNEMLLAGQGTQLKWHVLTHQKKYSPDCIINAKDLWERYKESSEVPSYPYPSFMPKLQQMTDGARPGSIVLITAGTGCGKTQFCRELKYHYWKTTNEKIADVSLEEDVSDTTTGLMSLHLNKRLHLSEVSIDADTERRTFQELFDDGRWTFYDHFGGMDDSSLFTSLRYLAADGNKFIFLDHLSIIVSEYAAGGGERERIDTIMTKLAKFVKEFNLTVFLICHLRKTEGSSLSFELGAVPTLDDLRGSGAIKQLSWDIIALSRNLQHPDKYCSNTIELSVLKCRQTGRTGVADYLHFSDETGRLLLTSCPPNYRLPKDKFGKASISSEDSSRF